MGRQVTDQTESIDYARLDDVALVGRAQSRDGRALREITTRYNQRLFRAAWSVLRDHAEAEEVVQDSYLRALAALQSFKGESSLSTWLVRITLNAAIDRRRAMAAHRREYLAQDVALFGDYRERAVFALGAAQPDAAHRRAELAKAITQAINLLPPAYAAVFILRNIEHMSVREVAEALNVSSDVVKTRLLRARRVLRHEFEAKFEELLADAIDFGGVRCKAMTERVVAALKD